MAPREPQDISDHESAPDSDSASDSESVVSEPAHLLSQVSQEAEPEDVEEEYHTEDSDASDVKGVDEENGGRKDDDKDDDEDGDDSDPEVLPPGAPLLPPELLEPLPSPAYSVQPINIPWAQMTRKQKKAQRSRNRQSKKRVWDQLKQDAKGTGVLEAGRVAQMKRGLVPRKDRVFSGRVEKKAKPQVSGRQQLLEQRKRLVEESGSGLMIPAKRAKSTRKG